jgi:hypothetical protein
LHAGKFADPPPALIAKCENVKPSNDAEEQQLGIADYSIHKARNESKETTDDKLKTKVNQPFKRLQHLGEKKAVEAWEGARSMVEPRKKAEKARRDEILEIQMQGMEKVEAQNAKRNVKAKEHKEEFKAVKIARNNKELKELLAGVGKNDEKLGKQIVLAQIRQLTKNHGVSTHTLPTTKSGRRLPFADLFDNLSNFLARCDPLAKPRPKPKSKPKSAQTQARKRGRPQVSEASKAESQKQKRRRTEDSKGDMEWDRELEK